MLGEPRALRARHGRRWRRAGAAAGRKCREFFLSAGREAGPGWGRERGVLIHLGMVQGHTRHAVAIVRALPEVLEWRVPGTACFLIKAVLPSMARLEALIEQLSAYGQEL